MLRCSIKFCGGCNPGYDRGKSYKQICSQLAGVAEFSLPEEGEQYDVLLILRGCTGCPYLYEEISAAHRIICTNQQEADSAPAEISRLAR